MRKAQKNNILKYFLVFVLSILLTLTINEYTVHASFNGFNKDDYQYTLGKRDALCEEGAKIYTDDFGGQVTKRKSENGGGLQIGCLVIHQDDFKNYSSTYDYIFNELVKSYYANLQLIELRDGYKPPELASLNDALRVMEGYTSSNYSNVFSPITEEKLREEARIFDEHLGEIIYVWANGGKTRNGEIVTQSEMDFRWERSLKNLTSFVRGETGAGGDNSNNNFNPDDYKKYRAFGSPGFFTNGFGTVVGECEYFVDTSSNRDQIYRKEAFSNVSGKNNPNNFANTLEEIQSGATGIEDTTEGSGRGSSRSSKAVQDVAGSVTDASVNSNMKDGQTLTGVNCSDFGLFNTFTKLFDPVNVTNVRAVMEITNVMQNIALGLGAVLIAVYGIYVATGNISADPFRFLLRAFTVIFIVMFLPYFVQDLLNTNNYIVYQIAFNGIKLGDAAGPLIGIVIVQAIAFALSTAAAMFVSGVGISLLIVGVIILLYFIITAAKIIFTLLFWWYSRLLTIFFLVAVGPAFVISLMLPKTSEYGSKWLRFILSEVFSQTLFVIAVYVISSIFQDLGTINQVLNFGAFGNIILVYAAIIFLSKVPMFLQNMIGQSFGVLGWNDAVNFGQQVGGFVQQAGMAGASAAARYLRRRDTENLLRERDDIHDEERLLRAEYNALDQIQDSEERSGREAELDARRESLRERASALEERFEKMAEKDRRQEFVDNVLGDAKRGRINLGSNSDEIRKASINRNVGEMYSMGDDGDVVAGRNAVADLMAEDTAGRVIGNSAFTSEQAEYEKALLQAQMEEDKLKEEFANSDMTQEDFDAKMLKIDKKRVAARNKLERDVSEQISRFGNFDNPLYKDMQRRRIIGDIEEAAEYNLNNNKVSLPSDVEGMNQDTTESIPADSVDNHGAQTITNNLLDEKIEVDNIPTTSRNESGVTEGRQTANQQNVSVTTDSNIPFDTNISSEVSQNIESEQVNTQATVEMPTTMQQTSQMPQERRFVKIDMGGRDIQAELRTPITNQEIPSTFKINEGQESVYLTQDKSFMLGTTNDKIHSMKVQSGSNDAQQTMIQTELINQSVQDGARKAIVEIQSDVSKVKQIKQEIKPFSDSKFEVVGVVNESESGRKKVVMAYNENATPQSDEEIIQRISKGKIFKNEQEAEKYLEEYLKNKGSDR